MESVYIETTVVSYLVANPSRDLVVAGHQQVTRDWWKNRHAKFACFISDVVLDEVRSGDAGQAKLRLQALASFPRLSKTGGNARSGAAGANCRCHRLQTAESLYSRGIDGSFKI